jgi:hypothetical protein
MNACQILVKGGRVSFRSKAVDAKKFMRPVLKGSGRLEDPTTNMTEALCFGQIIDDFAKLLFTLPEVLIELPKHKCGLVEDSRDMREFVSALHRYMVIKFAIRQSGGSVNEGLQRASNALSDSKSQ